MKKQRKIQKRQRKRERKHTLEPYPYIHKTANDVSLVHTTTQTKANKNKEKTHPVGQDKKTVFFFVFFPFVLSLLLIGLVSIFYAYVDVLCHTLDFIPFCSPLFSDNPYPCVKV